LEPATYLVRIYDEAGRNTGGYSLLWNYVNLASTPTPIPSQLTILSVDDTVIENNYAFYAFQGQAGQRVRIATTADDTLVFDPVIAILNPDGDIIQEADDSDGTLNPNLTFTLPEDGTYQVRVNGYLSGGRFTLTVGILFD
ncbi:MAG: PPC domain-containing protein, partial [Chloroflexota bacterium]